jgi:hypothetical protein
VLRALSKKYSTPPLAGYAFGFLKAISVIDRSKHYSTVPMAILNALIFTETKELFVPYGVETYRSIAMMTLTPH